MENTYLSGVLGKALTECLSEISWKQPVDPIEWIAHWLYRYMDKELYFYEKTIFQNELARMRLEIMKENEVRQKNINRINGEVNHIKKKVEADKSLCDGILQSKLEARGGKHDDSRSEYSDTISGQISDRGDKRKSSTKRSHSASARRRRHGSTSGSDRGSHDALAFLRENGNAFFLEFGNEDDAGRPLTEEEKLKAYQQKMEYLQQLGKLPPGMDLEYYRRHPSKLNDLFNGDQSAKASWLLDCNLGLVCDHNILGKMRGRPPFVPPETPSWWESQKYRARTLYDHEIYSTDASYSLSAWDNLKSMDYKDYIDKRSEHDMNASADLKEWFATHYNLN